MAVWLETESLTTADLGRITTRLSKLDDYTEHLGVNGGGSYTAQLTGHHHYTAPTHITAASHQNNNGDEMMGKIVYYTSLLFLSFT